MDSCCHCKILRISLQLCVVGELKQTTRDYIQHKRTGEFRKGKNLYRGECGKDINLPPHVCLGLLLVTHKCFYMMVRLDIIVAIITAAMVVGAPILCKLEFTTNIKSLTGRGREVDRMLESQSRGSVLTIPLPPLYAWNISNV